MPEYRGIILLSIDALRADHLSYHGYSRDTSPHLDRLAAKHGCFMNAISASSHTREAVPALLTGQYPGVFARQGYQLVGDSVASILSDEGYETAGFHSNPYVSRAYGFDAGFDVFDDDMTLGKNKLLTLAEQAAKKFILSRGESYARASQINDRSLNWLDSLDADDGFFLWNHYMDTHGPYNPPQDFSAYTDEEISNSKAQKLHQRAVKEPESITASERELLIDLYDGEIGYLDTQIHAFFEGLRERGLLDETAVIITADHGDGFAEHGYYSHPRHLHEELVHVPLIVSVPDRLQPSLKTQTPVSTLDIVPTILEFLGIDGPALPGVSLYSSDGNLTTKNLSGIAYSGVQGENENSHVRRFAVRDERWKCIIERDVGTGEVLGARVYDLRKDPSEQTPIDSEEQSKQVSDLRSKLEIHSNEQVNEWNNSNDNPAEKVETNEEIEQRLKALGYK